jgi:hypothetical protein
MPIGWDALTALGSFGQCIVVLVAAFLGLRQLVHLRRQSELEASLPLLSAARSPENQATYSMVVAAANGADPQLCAELEKRESSDPRAHAVLTFAHFLNEIGLLIEEGLITGATIVPHYRTAIVMTWDLLVPFVRQRRQDELGSSFFAPFEALAVRARAMTAGDRFLTARESLPRSLRPAFDQSLNQTCPTAAPQTRVSE